MKDGIENHSPLIAETSYPYTDDEPIHAPKMHENVNIDVPLVCRLVAGQFPQWADLPIKPVEPGGVDNRTFYLGRDMSVRLPSAEVYIQQVEKEHRWLPKLAPLLPLPIPIPLAKGVPAEGYPWQWSVYRWIGGETAKIWRISDLNRLALDLARFLTALYRVDPTGGPPPGQHNFFRGGPLTFYDNETRQALFALERRIDTDAAHEMWETALAAKWHGQPVWFHGDIAWGNLLVRDGRLSAVIDFGTSGVGDPSCDLAVAWTLFRGESREVFLSSLGLDDATWARGRGWTLWKALITLAEHIDTNRPEAEESRRVIDELLSNHGRKP